MRRRSRQGGWAGLIGLLIVLAVVLVLGRIVLQQMGMLGARSAPASTPLSRQSATDASSAQGASSAPSFTAPIERARGLDAVVQQQARDAAAQLERSSQ
jgi:predicted lipid-binding transport protein (Tim44 family)